MIMNLTKIHYIFLCIYKNKTIPKHLARHLETENVLVELRGLIVCCVTTAIIQNRARRGIARENILILYRLIMHLTVGVLNSNVN